MEETKREEAVAASSANAGDDAAETGEPARSAGDKRPRESPGEAGEDGAADTGTGDVVSKDQQEAIKVSCELCGHRFPSKNKLFKHLRDGSNPCGAQCNEKGGVRVGASGRAKALHVKTGHKAGDQSRQRWRYQAGLWLGDIPAGYATLKRVRKVLWDTATPGTPQPWVRKLIRKGYRHNETREWLGYVFLAYRDEEEAKEAMKRLSGVKVDETWTFKVRPLVKKEGGEGEGGAGEEGGDVRGAPLAAGEDPPLEHQLMPWPVQELVKILEPTLPDAQTLPDETLLAEACRMYADKGGRPVREVRDAPSIPEAIRAPLLEELRRTRWPPNSHRGKVTAEQYLVIKRQPASSTYEDLRKLAGDVLRWADPGFEYDHMAVTKNFISSPHIDFEDSSHQYALALGDYKGGGELCVDSGDGEVWCVDTRDRIARVDGRYVHWVRGYGGGDRYSVIYYVNRPQNGTPKERAVHHDWVPAGAAAAAEGGGAAETA